MGFGCISCGVDLVVTGDCEDDLWDDADGRRCSVCGVLEVGLGAAMEVGENVGVGREPDPVRA